MGERHEVKCNAGYVLLVLFIALILLDVAYEVNWLYSSFHVPLLLEAFNRNQLTVFIVVALQRALQA